MIAKHEVVRPLLEAYGEDELQQIVELVQGLLRSYSLTDLR